MALPTTGPLSMSQVNVELGLSSTATISFNQANVRTLAGVPSGAISMQNLRGKANQFAFTIASNQTNANLRTLAVNAGWNQSSKVVATINSGIYISSNGTGTPALTINGSFPNGVELTNNGFIIGRGGNGGAGQSVSFAAGVITGFGGTAGASGGLALSVAVGVSLRNNGTIGGGGGGGATQQRFTFSNPNLMGGGGGGGGRSSAAANSSGGAGGSVSGGTGGQLPGGAGGAGTVSSAGSGGVGGTLTAGKAGDGGSGGNWGAAGATGGNISGDNTVINRGGPFAGGASGAAISGNSNIAYLATGTRLGAIT